MRARFVLLLAAAVSFGFAPVFVRAQDGKDQKKDEAKKGGCCGEDGGCDKDAGGCEGCGKDDKSFAKAISCKDCKASEKGVCEKCVAAMKDGKVSFVPVSGMMCGKCSGAVSAKLEKVEGIQKYAVGHLLDGVAVFVEPGKTVRLSEIKKALGDGKFAIDEEKALAGAFTLKIDTKDDKVATTACDIVCKLLGIDCKSCKANAADGLTYNFTGKNVTIKQIKDKLAEQKISLADIEIHGPKAAENGKS